MPKETREMGKLEAMLAAVREAGKGIQEVAPGLSLNRILSEIGSELKEQAKHGAHELAAALFNGNAFVLYPRHNEAVDEVKHGLPPEAMHKQQQDHGMSM